MISIEIKQTTHMFINSEGVSLLMLLRAKICDISTETANFRLTLQVLIESVMKKFYNNRIKIFKKSKQL